MDYFDLEYWKNVNASMVGNILYFFLGLLFSGFLFPKLLVPAKNRITDYRNNKKMTSLVQKLNILNWEKEHLEKVNRSSVALSRVVYSDIFWLLLYLSIGLGIPILGPVIANNIIFFKPIVQFLLPLAIPVWAVSIIIAIHNINKLNNLNNYAKTIEKLDSKIQKVQQRIDELSSK